jgi:hypothetical protein
MSSNMRFRQVNYFIIPIIYLNSSTPQRVQSGIFFVTFWDIRYLLSWNEVISDFLTGLIFLMIPGSLPSHYQTISIYSLHLPHHYHTFSAPFPHYIAEKVRRMCGNGAEIVRRSLSVSTEYRVCFYLLSLHRVYRFFGYSFRKWTYSWSIRLVFVILLPVYKLQKEKR